MFDRCTEAAIKTIMLAQEEARRLGHNYVGAEQILLGLIGEGRGIASKSLKKNGVTLKAARAAVEQKIGRGMQVAPFRWYAWWKMFSVSSDVQFAFKGAAKRACELACEESDALGNHYVGTEHLLLGLIKQAKESVEVDGTESVVAQILQTLGVDLNVLREDVLRLIKEGKKR